MKKTTGFLLVIFFVLSCEDSYREPVLVNDTNFFPSEPFLSRTYEVDEIIYEISGNDTLHYFLREQVVDSFINAGITTYLLQVERAETIEGDWKIQEIVPVRITESEVVRRENGADFVKLIFPVDENKSWDGNKYNTLSFQDYQYETDPIIDSEVISAKAVRVIISDIPPNVVDQDQQDEVYAEGIGLIEKNLIILKFDLDGEIETGRFLSQRLTSYERE